MKSLTLMNVWHGLWEGQQGASVAGQHLCPLHLGLLRSHLHTHRGSHHQASRPLLTAAHSRSMLRTYWNQEERPLSVSVFLQCLYWQTGTYLQYKCFTIFFVIFYITNIYTIFSQTSSLQVFFSPNYYLSIDFV